MTSYQQEKRFAGVTTGFEQQGTCKGNICHILSYTRKVKRVHCNMSARRCAELAINIPSDRIDIKINIKKCQKWFLTLFDMYFYINPIR